MSRRTGLLLAMLLCIHAGASTREGFADKRRDPLEGLEKPGRGWTVFKQAVDTHLVFVSSSLGDDANDGRSPKRPLKTIAAGAARMRQGRPDWLLLRCGDDWREDLTWQTSGRPGKPTVLGSYGSGPRPVVGSGRGTAFSTMNQRYVAVVGIRFDGRNSARTGLWTIQNPYNRATNHWLVEDCVITGFGIGLQMATDGAADVTLRRCIVTDNRRFGILGPARNMVLEECLFDGNGTSGARDHNLYLPNHVDLTIRRCIISNASDAGIKIQTLERGSVRDNLLFANGSAASPNCNPDPKDPGRAVVGLEFAGNVCVAMGSRTDAEGTGLYLWANQDCAYRNNLFVNKRSVGDSAKFAQPNPAISIRKPFYNAPHAGALEKLIIEDNTFYDWPAVFLRFGDWPRTGVHVRRNLFQVPRTSPRQGRAIEYVGTVWKSGEVTYAANVYHIGNAPRGAWFRSGDRDLSLKEWIKLTGEKGARAHEVRFADPARTVATYDRSTGGPGTQQHFLSQARGQSKHNWQQRYTAGAVIEYLREGFRVLK